MFLTLMLTGLRRFELLGLRWRDVNLVEGVLRVAVSKSEEGERSIALSPLSSTHWPPSTSAPRSAATTSSSSAIPRRGSQIDHEWYAAEFRAALAEAGVEGYVRPFHDARHGGAHEHGRDVGEPDGADGDGRTSKHGDDQQYLHLAGCLP